LSESGLYFVLCNVAPCSGLGTHTHIHARIHTHTHTQTQTHPCSLYLSHIRSVGAWWRMTTGCWRAAARDNRLSRGGGMYHSNVNGTRDFLNTSLKTVESEVGNLLAMWKIAQFIRHCHNHPDEITSTIITHFLFSNLIITHLIITLALT